MGGRVLDRLAEINERVGRGGFVEGCCDVG